jgi:hypothetical protein
MTCYDIGLLLIQSANVEVTTVGDGYALRAHLERRHPVGSQAVLSCLTYFESLNLLNPDSYFECRANHSSATV